MKAQIHAGGRGKAGGEVGKHWVEKEAKKNDGKSLITHQTGPQGKEVKRLCVRKPQVFQKFLSFLFS